MTEQCFFTTVVSVFAVICLEVNALELSSTLELPGNRKTAFFKCKWNKHQKPTHIEFLSHQNNLLFTCELITTTHACTRGPAAADRNDIHSSLDGLTWVTIRYVGPGDEGTYICDLFRGEEKTSSVSFLNYRQLQEVGPVEVMSSIHYPASGNNVALDCRWKVEQHPMLLFIISGVGLERKMILYCDLSPFPYNCPKTFYASSRHSTNTNVTGLVTMTIKDVQLEDHGNYRCQIVAFVPGTSALLFNVSDSYLTVNGISHKGTDFEVRMSINYPTTGTQELRADVTCKWKADLQPTFLFFMGIEREPLFICQLAYIPYECIRGRLATGRQGLTAPITGTLFMTITNLQTIDEGRYTCQVMKLKPGSANIDYSVSYVYLSFLDARRNTKASMSSSPKETHHNIFLLIFTKPSPNVTFIVYNDGQTADSEIIVNKNTSVKFYCTSLTPLTSFTMYLEHESNVTLNSTMDSVLEYSLDHAQCNISGRYTCGVKYSNNSIISQSGIYLLVEPCPVQLCSLWSSTQSIKAHTGLTAAISICVLSNVEYFSSYIITLNEHLFSREGSQDKFYLNWTTLSPIHIKLNFEIRDIQISDYNTYEAIIRNGTNNQTVFNYTIEVIGEGDICPPEWCPTTKRRCLFTEIRNPLANYDTGNIRCIYYGGSIINDHIEDAVQDCVTGQMIENKVPALIVSESETSCRVLQLKSISYSPYERCDKFGEFHYICEVKLTGGICPPGWCQSGEDTCVSVKGPVTMYDSAAVNCTSEGGSVTHRYMEDKLIACLHEYMSEMNSTTLILSDGRDKCKVVIRETLSIGPYISCSRFDRVSFTCQLPHWAMWPPESVGLKNLTEKSVPPSSTYSDSKRSTTEKTSIIIIISSSVVGVMVLLCIAYVAAKYWKKTQDIKSRFSKNNTDHLLGSVLPPREDQYETLDGLRNVPEIFDEVNDNDVVQNGQQVFSLHADYITPANVDSDYITPDIVDNDYITPVIVDNDYKTPVIVDDDYITPVDDESNKYIKPLVVDTEYITSLASDTEYIKKSEEDDAKNSQVERKQLLMKIVEVDSNYEHRRERKNMEENDIKSIHEDESTDREYIKLISNEHEVLTIKEESDILNEQIECIKDNTDSDHEYFRLNLSNTEEHPYTKLQPS